MAKSFPNTGATVIDSAADLPAASAALEGILMFQKDTNELKICDGASWVSVIDTDTPPAMTLINPTSVAGTGVANSSGAVSFSASTTISLNGCFTTAYDSYQVLLSADSSVSDANLFFRLRSSGTDNSGTSYSFQNITANSATISGTRSTGATAFVGGNVTSSGPSNYRLTFMRPALAQHTGFYSDAMQPYLGNAWTYYVVGNHTVTSAYDGFTFYPSSGNITGTVRVYGYRNSI